MKLCMILPTHWKAFMGGSQYQAKCLLDALVDSDRYEILYLARRIDADYRPAGYRIQKISDDGGIRRPGFFLDGLRLLGMLKEFGPDVIYQRVACAYTGIAAYYARHNSCRLIWHIAHDNDVSPRKHTLAENIVSLYIDKPIVEYGLKNADRIVAQTGRQCDLLLSNYGKHCTAVIPNFHPDPKEEVRKGDTVRIMWVANLKQWKQPETFVRLAADLQGLRNAEFVMIGAPPGGNSEWRNSLMSSIEETANLAYLGQRSQDEINEMFAHSHIFVNTSLAEGFANTFIQAWMRRVPVVSLHVNPDNVFDAHDIGYFSQTYERLVDDVRRLIENRELREKMASEAQEYAFERHSMKNATRLMELFDGCGPGKELLENMDQGEL